MSGGNRSTNRFDELRRQADQALRTHGAECASSRNLQQIDGLLHELQAHQTELEMQNEELRHVQQELEASREKYSNLYDFAPVAYFTLNATGKILEANLTGASLLGEPRGRLLGSFFPLYLTPESKPIFHAHLSLAFESQAPQRCEVELQRHDGRRVWIQLDSMVPEAAHPDGLQCRTIAGDITERKRAAEGLRESEARFRFLIESIPHMVWAARADGYIDYCNQRVQDYLGLPQAQMEGSKWIDVLHPDDRQRASAAWEESLRLGMEYRVEYRIRGGREGEYRWIQDHAVPMRDAEGRIARWFGTCTDIDERKRAEEALQEREERLRIFIEHAPVALAMFDRQMRYISVSRRWMSDYGLAGDDLCGLSHYDVFPEISEDWKEVHRRGLAGEVVRADAERFDRADGSVQWLRWEVRPWRDADGNVAGIVIFSEDITESKRTEEQLRELTQRLTYHMDYSPLAVIEWGPDMSLTRWSGEAERIFGWKAEEVLGKHMEDFRWIYSDDEPLVSDVTTELLTGANPSRFSTNRNYRKDGSVVHCEWYNSSLLDESGKLRSILSLVLDVTKRKEAEESLRIVNVQLAEADRRKDEFLAMLAHELRNPLAPIRNAVQVLRIAGPIDPRLHRQRDIIDRQVTHMARLLDDLLDISRITRGKITLKRQPLHLADVLVHAVETVTPLIEIRRHNLDLTLPPDGLRVDGDLDRLAQAVGNLLANAAKYTPEGGRIWLEATHVDGQALVRVRDTGVGIAPEMLPHVFDLFTQADNSLARTQGGLGIGLTMARNLVMLHGGTVEAHSAGLGHGSEFIIRLPALPDEIRETAPPQSASEPSAVSSTHRILVVDDVADTTVSLAELLELWGHEVRMAFDGAAGLELARAFQPDVVLLDIGLPGMDGFEVARRLRQEHASGNLLLVALTGYAQDSDRQLACEAGFDVHLSKPVDLSALRELLDRA